MTDVTKENIVLLWSTVRKRAMAKGFSFNMGMPGTRVSAEEPSCLEGGRR